MSSYQYGSAYRERPNNNDGYGKNEYGSGSHSRRNNITPKPYEHDPYGEGYSNGSDRYKNTSNSNTPPPPPQSSARHQPRSRDGAVWVPQPAQRMQQESDASRQIGIVLDRVKSEWPSMCQNDCVPVQMAIQLLDTSSVGKAHLYPAFQKTHTYLQDSLKNIVHEHHQGFNSSIGAYHKIQGSIQASQKRVRALKDSLASSKTAICATDPELKKLHKSSEMYDDLIQTLDELEELRLVPDQLEARISEKRFLNAVSVLQTALRKLRKTKLAGLGALSDLRSYLSNQETSLMDILVEELHDHLYLKSPYCQERWNCLAKTNKGNIGESNGSDNNWSAISGANGSPSTPVIPFQQLLDSIDFERHVSEDPSKNPEADTFHYIMLLVEALNKLGRLESAVDTLKQRLPVELFSVVNDTVVDMDQKHPASMRGSSSGTRRHVRSLFDDRETQMKRRVINDLLGNLYAKFEAIAEGHRIFHEAIKAIIRREGAGNNSALLGSFKELWNLYQNELRSLVHNYVTTEADVYQNTALHGGMGNVGAGGKRDNLYKFAEADPKASNILTESEALESIIEAAVPGLTSNSRSLQNSSNSKKGDISSGAVSSTSRSSFGLPSASRRSALSGTYSSNLQSSGSVKSLVEPSVFNMSLLLPGTLSFLQRLKNIVPPGSDLATSTLTSFLDNILVNVFQPQVDETLAKHCEAIYGSSESFLEDANWKHVAKKPIFMGTSDFYAIIAAFCAMLDTIPHDQALSTLILGQLNRYYERCSEWYQGLASHHQASMTEKPPLRYSARIANENNDIKNLMRKLAVMASPNGSPLDEEVDYFITKASKELNKEDDIMRNADQVKDKEGIAAMCLLYTSMKWLSVKVQALRFITKNNTDSSRFNKPTSKRWSQLNDAGRVREKQGSIYLPMTEETVQYAIFSFFFVSFLLLNKPSC